MQADRELDTRGLNCPLPVLKTKKALFEMQTGQRLRVVATDPGAPADFATFAKNTGHQLLESQEAGGEYIFLIEKV